ncbi:MAG: GNAT family N-acetyltransferase [Bacteroidales bacterium]|nr:GNAT family N-acetyltransferase [Bacteroidales bacterium]
MNLSIHPMHDLSALKNFECGIPKMDAFIQNSLHLSIENHYCLPYACEDEQGKLVAFFALSFDSLSLDEDDKADLALDLDIKGYPIESRYSETFYGKSRYPALEIAYLAVSKEYRKSGIGSTLLNAIFDIAKSQRVAGCQFITVEALVTNEYSAVGFYAKSGFSQGELLKAGKETILMFAIAQDF